MALLSTTVAILLEQGSGHAEQLTVQERIVTDHVRRARTLLSFSLIKDPAFTSKPHLTVLSVLQPKC